MPVRFLSCLVSLIFSATAARADVGDPQVATDHPWYPGELSCSTFERLAATQAKLYRRVVGTAPVSDEQKALAAWLWRNTHYYHGEDGALDLWGQGFAGGDTRAREYWTGLFANGFGLCGTTHSQWCAEMEALLGHSRGRGVGVEGHNSFEVYLTGGPYGKGKWVLLDHDTSTVVFNRAGTALLSIDEIHRDWRQLTNRSFTPARQHGWLICGLHPDDAGVYRRYDSAEYLAGYGGVPPLVHLRRGEKLRRYLEPGLSDGKTFVFWGRNYNTGGIAGPERAQTWVNQPDKMFGSKDGTGYHPGQARYGNAVYTYTPDFQSGSYREGVIAEGPHEVAFEFYTPYLIAATPAGPSPWAIYEAGCRNGLLLHGTAHCSVSLSTDQGRSWQECGPFSDGLDLTDRVKGRRQYFLRFGGGAAELAGSGLRITTICQSNAAILPQLKDHGSRITFQASSRAVVSAGPHRNQAQAHIVSGQFDSPAVTLEIAPPRHETPLEIHAAAHIASGSPPRPDVKYHIEFSTDQGKTWKPIVRDWTISRRGQEPNDFWSQSMCWGNAALPAAAERIYVRFRNDGGRNYLRAEAHLVYRTQGSDATKVTFAWKDDQGEHEMKKVVARRGEPVTWAVPTGSSVRTRWVEFEPVDTR
jgi:hypothetical protein